MFLQSILKNIRYLLFSYFVERLIINYVLRYHYFSYR